ncbi:MAG: DNA repair exonuclease, partial [Mesorhizobium sp.]
ARQVHPGAKTVVMPGMPQGRDINEAGEKSVTLVTIGDDRSLEIEERLTSVAQFERVSVDLTGTMEWPEVVGRVRSALEDIRASVRSRHAVVRLGLTGATPLSWALIRDRDLLLAEAEQAAEQTGDTWVEKLELDLAPQSAETGGIADPIFELAESMRADAKSEAFRAEARALVQKMVADLPPDGRDFAGRDEAELELFLDRVLASSADLVTARLKAGGAR